VEKGGANSSRSIVDSTSRVRTSAVETCTLGRFFSKLAAKNVRFKMVIDQNFHSSEFALESAIFMNESSLIFYNSLVVPF
jgi:hypothetical protein